MISSQPLNLDGRWGTADDVHIFMSSAAQRESPNPISVHCLMLSSYLFFCLPLIVAPFTLTTTRTLSSPRPSVGFFNPGP